MPCDPEYGGGQYVPVDEFKIYCGNELNLPVGYDKMGSPSECLRKGIGIGKQQVAENGCPSRRFYLFWLIFIVLVIPPTVVLILKPPKFFKVERYKDGVIVENIDFSKLVIYLLAIYLIIFMLIKIVWTRI
jgi:hypothetical protein